jgi:hypothetical protein
LVAKALLALKLDFAQYKLPTNTSPAAGLTISSTNTAVIVIAVAGEGIVNDPDAALAYVVDDHVLHL